MKKICCLLLLVFATAHLRADPPVDLKSIHKILFLGDSITKHQPDASLGWTGDWGMAATALDKDYVHVFLAKLAEAQGAGAPAPEVLIFGKGGGKVSDQVPYADQITAFKADLALIQMGENDRDITATGFQQPYEKLLAAIKAGNPNVRILCAGVWGVWPTGDHTKDSIIRDACQKYGATFADLGATFTDPSTHAESEHKYTSTGVNWHPSDAGMAAYADAFWKALTGVQTAATTPPPAAAANPDPTPAGTASATPTTAQAGGQPLFEFDEKWTDPPVLAWVPVPPIGQTDGRAVAKITSTGDAGATFAHPVDVSQFAGHIVTIHTRVKADGVSEPPQPYNGIKVMFRLDNAEGKTDFPQFRLPAGTYDWKDVDWTLSIPDNTVTLIFWIGLEKVTGTVSFDELKISVMDSAAK